MKKRHILVAIISISCQWAYLQYTPGSPFHVVSSEPKAEFFLNQLKSYNGKVWNSNEIKQVEAKITENNAMVLQAVQKNDKAIANLIDFSEHINQLPQLTHDIALLEKEIANLKEQQKSYLTDKQLSILPFPENSAKISESYKQQADKIVVDKENIPDHILLLEKELEDKKGERKKLKDEINVFLSKNNSATQYENDEKTISVANHYVSLSIEKLNKEKMRLKEDEITSVFNIPLQADETSNEAMANKAADIVSQMCGQFQNSKNFFNYIDKNGKIVFANGNRQLSETWMYVNKEINGVQTISVLSRYEMDNYQKKENVTRGDFFEETEGVVIEMIFVKGGDFIMGSPVSVQESDVDERPQHKVTVPDFYIGKYEVTQEQWEAIMGSNPSGHKDCPDCPVESINIKDVETFLQQLNLKTGKNYRLPTESEWEYAARGGQKSMGYLYSGSNDIDKVTKFYSEKCKGTGKVGQKAPNELGLYDMSGNVWEWVEDCWHNSYDGAPTDGTAWKEGCNTQWVNRGGSCGYHERYLRVANRNDDHPTKKRDVVGLRLVLSAY